MRWLALLIDFLSGSLLLCARGSSASLKSGTVRQTQIWYTSGGCLRRTWKQLQLNMDSNSCCNIFVSSSTCCSHYTQPPATITASTASSSHDCIQQYGFSYIPSHSAHIQGEKQFCGLLQQRVLQEGPGTRTKVEVKIDDTGSAEA
jgi:hypothetical protein